MSNLKHVQHRSNRNSDKNNELSSHEKHCFSPWKLLSQREVRPSHSISGFQNENQFWPGMIKKFGALSSWDPINTTDHTAHGAIFNFDFSPDGSILVAACEKESLLVFDPYEGKLINYKTKAHSDCVNCVRFLDSRIFVTCSDDTTVNLWDIRYMKSNYRTLRGHSNWVKNIEYDHNSGLLVTSGFDGSIYSWDINSYSDSEQSCKRVYHTEGLMRSKLTPDASKLVISSSRGYLMVVHNLDLQHISSDLHSFKPASYRLWQKRPNPVYEDVIKRKRNQVELIQDFPVGNNAGVIASLQVHPQGWCVLSRNTNMNERSEYTCVHDIQETKRLWDMKMILESESDITIESEITFSSDESTSTASESLETDEQSRNDENIQSTNVENQQSRILENEQSINVENQQSRNVEDQQSMNIEIEQSRNVENQQSGNDDENQQYRNVENQHISKCNQRFKNLMHKNSRLRHEDRLMFYTEEPNVGRGFIKELCFSHDGRIVCSPFAFGTRLLTYDSNASELCDVTLSHPKELTEIASCTSHRNVVITTKFSPINYLFVSGCLDGKVAFHKPIL